MLGSLLVEAEVVLPEFKPAMQQVIPNAMSAMLQPHASSLQPHASSLQPHASSLQSHASSLQPYVPQVISNAMSGINTENFELPLYSRLGHRVELLLNATSRHSAGDAVVGVVMVGQVSAATALPTTLY